MLPKSFDQADTDDVEVVWETKDAPLPLVPVSPAVVTAWLAAESPLLATETVFPWSIRTVCELDWQPQAAVAARMVKALVKKAFIRDLMFGRWSCSAAAARARQNQDRNAVRLHINNREKRKDRSAVAESLGRTGPVGHRSARATGVTLEVALIECSDIGQAAVVVFVI